LAALAEYQIATVEHVDFQAYVVDGLETVGLFNDGSIGRIAVNGIALYEETVTRMLEVTEHFAFGGILHPDNGTRETQEVGVRTFHAPHSEEVACLAAFLAGKEEEGER
jgi:hypothetical protein